MTNGRTICITRLFLVLEVISRRELTLARIAAILDMNSRTALRYIYRLQDLGFDIVIRRQNATRWYSHTGKNLPGFLKKIINHHKNDQRN